MNHAEVSKFTFSVCYSFPLLLPTVFYKTIPIKEEQISRLWFIFSP